MKVKQINKNIELYKQGEKLYIEKQWSLTKISKELHMSRGRLSTYLKEQRKTYKKR